MPATPAGVVRRKTSVQDSQRSPYAQKYLIKRPVIKERISNCNNTLDLQTATTDQYPLTRAPLTRDDSNDDTSDDPILEKRRFELFIDLIWVGIVSNLAENFSEEAFSDDSATSAGRATVNFILLFVTAWRLWKFLQIFMSKYHTNDLIERVFVIWILILALLYGNSAPYLLVTGDDQSNLAVVVYLIARGSFLVIESIYSLYIPFLRRGVLIRGVAAMPLIGIWIAMLFVSKERNFFLLIAVTVLEVLADLVISAPFLEHFLREERAKGIDPDHWVERIREFFTIILGEGVLNLISGSPLGRGFNDTLKNGISVLVIYYALIGFYFIGDQSRRYIHPVKRAWWRKELWQLLHVILFHALLMLGVGVGFMLKHPLTSSVVEESQSSKEGDSDEEERIVASHMGTAKWAVSIALPITLASQILIAFLSKSLDTKRTLKIDNRYLRLAPRAAVMVVVVCLAIEEKMVASAYLTIVVWMLVVVLLWEFVAGLDHSGGLVEP